MSLKLFYTLMFTMLNCTNIFSQHVRGTENINLYFGLSGTNSFQVLPFDDDVEYSFPNLNGILDISYSPTMNNIWQIAFGNKTDLSQSETWFNLNPNELYFITDSVNPYPQNIEHSIKFNLDQTVNLFFNPIIHDLNVSIAQGDTILIEFGNDENIENIDISDVNKRFIFFKESNELRFKKIWGTHDITNAYFNIDNRGFLMIANNYYNWLNDWELMIINTNYIKFTLISGENNLDNSGVAFGGFFASDALISTVNISELNKNKNLNVYPNPFDEILNIRNNLNIDLIEITDYTGKRVALFNYVKNITQMNLSNLKSGIYLVRFYKGSEIIKTEKVIKK